MFYGFSLARQPIFDSSLNVYGYELLYRSCRTNAFDAADGDLASMQVLATTLLTLGPDNVLGGKLGFINFTRELLLGDLAMLLPPDSFVIEILESVEPDDEVIAACRTLGRRGYRIALDDFILHNSQQPLVEFADILKVDFRLTTGPERRRIVQRYGRPGLTMLAEKVETAEELASARREGFGCFQGYFFARPVILAKTTIPSFKVNLLRILSEVYSREFDLRKIEGLFKQDMPLCYRLLRYVNSAVFGWRSRINSIHQAIVLLGEEDVRRWLTLAALPALASDKPEELVETAVLRARFCELLAPCAGLSHRASDLFLLGMFSLLDAMVGRPLEELLEELWLADDVRGALVGGRAEDNPLARVYRLALAWERSEWDAVTRIAAELGLRIDVISDLYFEATTWCAQIFEGREVAV